MSRRPTDGKPKETLYLRNLDDGVRKNELRRGLHLMCSEFGPVLDVVALKTGKMRGQAFVVFQDIATANAALQALQDRVFYGKPIKAEYARETSFVINPAVRQKRDRRRAMEEGK